MKSWNEIRKDATAFSKRWRNAYDEKSQAQSFLKEFFAVFGVDAVTVATFEHRVKLADGSQGYIDCFWLGTILVEMKSRGKDLDAAYAQALEYVRALPDPSQTPRAIVVSDFVRIRFYDLSRDCALTEFPLKDLRKYVTLFGYMIGAEDSGGIREQDPVNRNAAEQMARLHDAMKSVGYSGHPLEVYLVRILFCLFAEDTGIFKPDQFCNFIKQRTSIDGHDLAPQLALLFQTLDTETRLANLDESLAAFPYVNGGLFAEVLPIAAFSQEMRQAILDCAALDWSKISPAIFGAMFQGVMDVKARHDLGAHYTSEENILKLIRPLFLDALRAEFNAIRALKGNAKVVRLKAFHEKIAKQTFLDPACGCGNFLLIGYREIRHLEMDVLEEIHKDDPSLVLDISQLCKVSVSQFYGIEIEPFPAEIAKTALWLMDHLCNMEVADRFGQYFARIPIKDAPHIVCANALTTDWPRTDYIMGNPPFLGRRQRTTEQHKEVARFFDYKDIDYVACWYAKANALMQGTATRCAFVSTNSITQGEQVAPLWRKLNAEIDFAYCTFKWHNKAKGVAAVHCVIIGFHGKGTKTTNGTEGTFEAQSLVSHSSLESLPKTIFDSDGTPHPADHINGYLMDAPDVIVESRPKPLCDVSQMQNGNVPLDGDALKIEAEDYAQFENCPFIKRLVGGRELLHNETRYVLWLVNAEPSEIRKYPLVLQRIDKCRENRLKMKDEGTRRLADFPMTFRDTNNPDHYIAIPLVSSEKRKYVPMAFLDGSTIPTNQIQIIPDATLYHFGILTSWMHMAWMRTVAGRLEMRYRYSKDIVYNNFVWPEVKDEAAISNAAQAVLDARAAHPTATLADLYDPLTMPPDLVKAHAHLDALVDKAYGLSPSVTDAERVAHLFKLYAERGAGAK